jgi:cell division protein FtsQ
VTATIDPRIRERRIEVKREAGRKRLRIIAVAMCIFLAIGSVYLLVESPLLDVDHVRISGASRLDPAVVEQAAAVTHGSPMLRLDTGAVRARVERLPWVANAKVTRALPGTVKIAVTERVPAVFVRRDDGHVVLVDASGFAIAVSDPPPDGPIEIRGVRRVPAVGATLAPAPVAGITRELPAALGADVGAIDVTDGVTLVLHNGGEVRLCTATDIAAKGAAASAVIASRSGAPFSYIDVCVPQSPSAR